MPDVPSQLDLPRHRDLQGRQREVWLRRVLLLALLALPVLALLNFFGQHAHTSTAHSAGATLSVRAPKRLRGGLLYEARFTINPKRALQNASLVLDAGWMEGMTLNTIEPAPSTEKSKNGALELDLGSIDAGSSWREVLQFQVNPTTVGHRSQNATLYDGDTPVVSVRRGAFVFP